MKKSIVCFEKLLNDESAHATTELRRVCSGTGLYISMYNHVVTIRFHVYIAHTTTIEITRTLARSFSAARAIVRKIQFQIRNVDDISTCVKTRGTIQNSEDRLMPKYL